MRPARSEWCDGEISPGRAQCSTVYQGVCIDAPLQLGVVSSGVRRILLCDKRESATSAGRHACKQV